MCDLKKCTDPATERGPDPNFTPLEDLCNLRAPGITRAGLTYYQDSRLTARTEMLCDGDGDTIEY